jgi:putative endonuclease
MSLSLIRLLGDARKKMKIGGLKLHAHFLFGFAHRAFEGRFAQGHLQFAADGTPDPQIRGLGPQHEQLLAGLVLEEDQHGDFIGQDLVIIGRLNAHAEKGESGENLAADYLARQKGFAIVARNWRNPQDRREEIDVIAQDQEVLVFVEVKTRALGARVPGYYAVDRAKREILRRAARAYLSSLAEKPRTFRLDVVEIELGTAVPEMRYFGNVGLFHKHYRP